MDEGRVDMVPPSGFGGELGAPSPMIRLGIDQTLPTPIRLMLQKVEDAFNRLIIRPFADKDALPAPLGNTFALARIEDENVLAFSDGTNWRRVDTGASSADATEWPKSPADKIAEAVAALDDGPFPIKAYATAVALPAAAAGNNNHIARLTDSGDIVISNGTAWQRVPVHLVGSATYDPASLNDGDGATTTVTVTGAALGDFAVASFSLDLAGVLLTAWVSAADTVSVRFQNESAGVVDLGSGTLRARVFKA